MYDRYRIVLPDSAVPGRHTLVVRALEAEGEGTVDAHGPLYEDRPDTLAVTEVWVEAAP